ncbi:uncharacterized protein LOC117530693 [Thalassophryne amazonica]|uniref:uncharacterized protein LOC117530693 n=1 Tax=Thalassophryne amazonica TaxID=390379 RepID=UPI001470DDA6|nr:uncharacterized protein LOC117530693 [Thalassophryne amazonica]
MSCVEKRHTSHRMGSMLHHRFPNSFNDLFMDETDREVSTLTDRAFRSLCIGDEAVYSDELLHGYSPFSCHKPLAEEPLKKTQKEAKRQAYLRQNDKNDAQPWKEQQEMSHMSSFLKALSATEGSCGGILMKNGGVTDTNGESWDKLALRSIQRELSEFSSDYHATFTDTNYRNHQRHASGNRPSKKTLKDAAVPSGKMSNIKNVKSTVKLKKLIIKNLFLHSEFSPFQTWTDLNRFPFGQEDRVPSILAADNIPKWCDFPFYKELTEARKKEEVCSTKEAQTCQKTATEPPPVAPKTVPPSPTNILPTLVATPADTRSLSDSGDGSAAPWRQNRCRTKNALPADQPETLLPSQENCSQNIEDSVLPDKKESLEVKAVEEASSLASTPFSICQLMTPVIPSRQPTETSEILQAILSSTALDLPLRPNSEAQVTSELPAKRHGYKSLASSILFNLKDNRKRVKSHYSPPKFKHPEVPEPAPQSPSSSHLRPSQSGSEDNTSSLSPPVILDGQTVCSPVLDPGVTPAVALTTHDSDRPPSEDYSLSNLLHTKREGAQNESHREENCSSSVTPVKNSKSLTANKENYPSLSLYQTANPGDSEIKCAEVPLSPGAPVDQQTWDLVSPTCPSEISLTDAGISPNNAFNFTSNTSMGKRPSLQNNATPSKDVIDTGAQLVGSRVQNGHSKPLMDVIRAAKEAINAAKSKALSAQSETITKTVAEIQEPGEKETGKQIISSTELLAINNQSANESPQTTTQVSKGKKEPPPVPKRNFTKSDIQFSLDKQQLFSPDRYVDFKPDLPPKLNASPQEDAKLKHIFSARQNNYIKYHRYAVTGKEQGGEYDKGDLKVKVGLENDEEMVSETRDSEHLINDLSALKELERARLEHTHRSAKNKLEEEAKARNDLISKELRNIKKGMLSMRGNTSAKREIFAKKEKEQRKHEMPDRKVIVNKVLLNDNYNKAKMALEEIISEREKRKKLTDESPISEENCSGKSYGGRAEQCDKDANVSETAAQKTDGADTSTVKETDLKERLDDLRDHKHMRQILSQTEPRLDETHRSGGRVVLPGMDRDDSELKLLQKNIQNRWKNEPDELADYPQFRSNELKEISLKCLMNREPESIDTPPVPPRSKKGGNRRDISNMQSLQEEVEEVVFTNDVRYENRGTKKQNNNLSQNKNTPNQSEISSRKEKWDQANEELLNSVVQIEAVQGESELKFWKSENSGAETESDNWQVDTNLTNKTTSENKITQGLCKVKWKAPLKPEQVNAVHETLTQNPVAEEADKKIRVWDEVNVEVEASNEILGNTISPLLLVNGTTVNHSPPDQASLSSKSSYFSAESALHRNTETESNVYHSMENLTGEIEEVHEATREVSESKKQDSERTEVEYYSLSDHESEFEWQIKASEQEKKALYEDAKETKGDPVSPSLTREENNQTPLSTSNPFSPTFGIPALFVVKDNTSINKSKKSVHTWPLRDSLVDSAKGMDETHQVKETAELPQANENPTIGNTSEILSNLSPAAPISSNLQIEDPKNPQVGGFLPIPQEEVRNSVISPSSERVESATTSTTDEMGVSGAVLLEMVPSKRSGSTCSGNDSQTGLPKPPAVLPKSEKAILRAMKLTNRRIKKEVAQNKSSHKSSQSNSKHKSESVTSTQKSSSSRSGRGSERKIKSSNERSEHSLVEQRGQNAENHQEDKTDTNRQKSKWQSHNAVKSKKQNIEGLPSLATEQQSSSEHGDKLEQRHCSGDRIISNVPVYKAQVSHRPNSNKPFHRSQSTDHYVGNKAERRLSAVSVNVILDPRSQRTEKSIMDELQQRGRARDRPSRDNPLRRSQSIDTYSMEGSYHSTLSRQSSHSSHLSRQSSTEHTIVAQSFPMTQRKLLQDPESGQLFFVDMPIQVKTKTLFDPETGNYVQLPIQPPEGAVVPQPSTVEVLNTPLVVYHSFVPVPLSPMAHKSTIHAPHMEELEQKHLERSRQLYCTEGHPYLEPLYGQHDPIIGGFLGTEELDCAS